MQNINTFINCINDALGMFAPGSGYVVYNSCVKNQKFPVLSTYTIVVESRKMNIKLRIYKILNKTEYDEESAWRVTASEMLAELFRLAQTGRLTSKHELIY